VIVIRDATPTDRPALFDVWLRSVRATHSFLSESDVELLAPLVRDYLASDATEFRVACDGSGAPIGFMGLSRTADEVESMFLAPERLRRGIGRALLDDARSRRPGVAWTVSVNEANDAARRFYEAVGFVVTGRSERDAAGRPFPLLHLRLDDAPLIERLARPASDADVRALARLLAEIVESGAAVSFVAPLSLERAEAFWRDVLAQPESRVVVLVARESGRIVGTVQLHPAWAPNQPDRAEIAKLLVERDRRGRGLGEKLMRAAEDVALRSGWKLLTLDAKRGEAAERLYRRLGWIHAGTIPRYALDPDGRAWHDAVILYKELAARGAAE